MPWGGVVAEGIAFAAAVYRTVRSFRQRFSPLRIYDITIQCRHTPSFTCSFHLRFSPLRIYTATQHRSIICPGIRAPVCTSKYQYPPVGSQIADDASLSFFPSFASTTAVVRCHCGQLFLLLYIRKSTVHHNREFPPVCVMSSYIRKTATQRAVSHDYCSCSLYIQTYYPNRLPPPASIPSKLFFPFFFPFFFSIRALHIYGYIPCVLPHTSIRLPS